MKYLTSGATCLLSLLLMGVAAQDPVNEFFDHDITWTEPNPSVWKFKSEIWIRPDEPDFEFGEGHSIRIRHIVEYDWFDTVQGTIGTSEKTSTTQYPLKANFAGAKFYNACTGQMAANQVPYPFGGWVVNVKLDWREKDTDDWTYMPEYDWWDSSQ